MNVSIDISNHVSVPLARTQRVLGNLTVVMREVGNTILNITKGNFYSHGAAFRPAPWPPKADGTPSTLKKSGRLSASFRLSYDANTATISTDAPYAAIHQFGGRTGPHVIRPIHGRALAFHSAVYGDVVVSRVNHPGSNIPARPFFPISDNRLTPAADRLVVRTIERTFARLVGPPLA